MRFLHTADWHLGKTLRGRSRLDEQRRALDQIVGAATDASVDAVLIAGDVYDSTMPPAEAEVIALDFLARLCREGIACVLIAGNHDHPRKLGALAALLESLRIHVRADVRRADQGGVVEVRSRDGTQTARIAALPFVSESRIVDAETFVAGTDAGYTLYAERLARLVAELSRSFAADTVNVLLAHVLIGGARFGTGERRLDLGEIFALQPESLPGNAHYAALGHLHRPQEIAGAPCRTAYAGSPIELDFGEREQDKRVVLVDAAPGTPCRITSVPITAGRRLLDVQGTLAELESRKAQLGDAFLRVTVQLPQPQPGVDDRVRALLPNALEVRQQWPRTDEPATVVERPHEPKELFAAFHRQERQIEPSAELLRLFGELHGDAAREDAES